VRTKNETMCAEVLSGGVKLSLELVPRPCRSCEEWPGNEARWDTTNSPCRSHANPAT